MLDADIFLKNSPFQITHGPTQQLNNTTPELLKFSLQEQYRNKLRELKDNHHDLPNLNLLHSQFLQDSFNNHLQKSLDEGIVSFDASSTANTTNSTSHILSSSPDTSISSSFKDNSNNNSNTTNTSPDTVSSASFSNEPNYLNLKVLIENSVFDTKNINNDSILSLTSLKQLKLKISDKQELKDYLQSKFAISQQFMTTMILNPEKYHELDIDNKLLLKIINSNHSLQQQLFDVVEELERLTTKLNNHNLACLVLGYVEDIKITSISNHQRQYLHHQQQHLEGTTSPVPSPMKSQGNGGTSGLPTPSREGFMMMDTNKSFDTLFSHIASMAAKKNIILPSPPTIESIDARIEWAIKCIDSLVSSGQDSSLLIPTRSPSTIDSISRDTSQFLNESSIHSSPTKSTDKALLEYKTALNDLRFSHQYLSKEYEYSKETSFKVIQDFRRKNAILEKENNRLKQRFSNAHDESGVSMGHSSSVHSTGDSNSATQQDLEAKEREITKLRKELNSLKIDNLGLKPSSASIGGMSPTNNLSSHSLVLGNDLHDDSGEDGDDLNVSRPVSSSGMSNGILRKEFKKIVGGIQDQYEVELGEERMRRRKLEEQLQQYELQNSSH